MTTLAIIGTAGRRDDATRISRSLYDAAFERVRQAIARHKIDAVVSGGAAFADHLAVRAFNEGLGSRLTLHLPAKFAGGRFAGNRDADTANYYHRQFSDACGLPSLTEIGRAIDAGATVTVSDGFFVRNKKVADDADILLALTFGSRASEHFPRGSRGYALAAAAGLKDGGTAHTWDACRSASLKLHVNLAGLIATAPAAADAEL